MPIYHPTGEWVLWGSRSTIASPATSSNAWHRKDSDKCLLKAGRQRYPAWVARVVFIGPSLCTSILLHICLLSFRLSLWLDPRLITFTVTAPYFNPWKIENILNVYQWKMIGLKYGAFMPWNILQLLKKKIRTTCTAPEGCPCYTKRKGRLQSSVCIGIWTHFCSKQKSGKKGRKKPYRSICVRICENKHRLVWMDSCLLLNPWLPLKIRTGEEKMMNFTHLCNI